jgi:cellulose synthase/poly-beta-1,6-N-acetylglucosamine synthase-like glycosyltransferase
MDATLWVLAVSLGLLAYVHVGYPLLVWTLGRLWPRPIRAADITPPIAFIVAAYNESGVIAAKIDNTLALDYPPDRLRVVVICDGSTDDTAEIARRAGGGRITVLQAEGRRGKGAAMNRAADMTDEPILVFSDANAMYRADAVRWLVRPFNDDEVGLSSGHKTVTRGPHIVGEGEGAYWSYESWLRRAETAVGSTVGVVGEIMAIRRTCFSHIPPHVINDDTHLCMGVLRAGQRVVFVPEAISLEGSAATQADEMVRRTRFAASRVALLLTPREWPWKRPFTLFQLVSHKFLRLFAPWCLLLTALATVAALRSPTASPILWAVLGGQVVLYGLAAIGAAGRRAGPLRRPARLAAFVIAGHIASAVGVLAYLSGRASPLWERVARRPEHSSERL